MIYHENYDLSQTTYINTSYSKSNKKHGIKQIVISTETNPVVSARVKKLDIPCVQSINNKKDSLKDYCEKNRIELETVAYIGNDINDKTNPLEAGLSWITVLNKKKFIGIDSIKKEKKNGLKKHLVAFKMQERGVPRPGYEIYLKKNIVGFVTSGNHSPSLNIGIGLAYVDYPFHIIGQELKILIRNKYLNAIIVKPPFINRGSLHN